MYHVNLNPSLTVANVILIKSEKIIKYYRRKINGNIIHNSVITCDEIIDTADSISTNVSCSVPINAENTASINFDDKKVRYSMDCILQIVFFDISWKQMLVTEQRSPFPLKKYSRSEFWYLAALKPFEESRIKYPQCSHFIVK